MRSIFNETTCVLVYAQICGFRTEFEQKFEEKMLQTGKSRFQLLTYLYANYIPTDGFSANDF